MQARNNRLIGLFTALAPLRSYLGDESFAAQYLEPGDAVSFYYTLAERIFSNPRILPGNPGLPSSNLFPPGANEAMSRARSFELNMSFPGGPLLTDTPGAGPSNQPPPSSSGVAAPRSPLFLSEDPGDVADSNDVDMGLPGFVRSFGPSGDGGEDTEEEA